MSERYQPSKPEKFEDMCAKALADPEIKAEYESFRVQYNLAKKMRKLREAAHVTQEELAVIMRTHKPVISRLETTQNIKNSPSLLTLTKYALALGCTLKINFVPFKKEDKHMS